MATQTRNTSATLAANGQATDWLQVSGGNFDVSLVGSGFTGTVAIQRKRVNEDDSAARTVESFDMSTNPTERFGTLKSTWLVRAIIAAYTAGSVAARIDVEV